jgi:hypothetical protein
MMQKILKIAYRLAYLAGVTSLVLSMTLASSVKQGAEPVFAQGSWNVVQFCNGFSLVTPDHPDIAIIVDFAPTGQGPWENPQNFSAPGGGPATYNYQYNPNPPQEWDARTRVFVAPHGELLFIDIQKVGACATNTPPPPTNTPGTPTNTPTNTPETPTNTPTNTPVTPTNTPTNTPVTPTSIPPTTLTPTNTPTGTITPPTSTPTFTPTDTPTSTPTFTVTPSGTPSDTPPTTPPPVEVTNTPIQPPAITGTPGELVPVSGFDFTSGAALNARLLMNLGIGLIGLGLVLHGFSLRLRREE